jgi:hypothetical protein
MRRDRGSGGSPSSAPFDGEQVHALATGGELVVSIKAAPAGVEIHYPTRRG